MDKNRSRWETLPTTPFQGSNLPPKPGERPSLNNQVSLLQTGGRLSWHAAEGDPGGVRAEGEPAASHIHRSSGVVRYVPPPSACHSHPLCGMQQDTNAQQSPLGWRCSSALSSGPNSEVRLRDGQGGCYQGSASYCISVSETCPLLRPLRCGLVLLCHKRPESGRLFKQVCLAP